MTTETIASYSVPEHYVKMYTANVQAALNKKGGVLTGLVSQGAYYGERAQVVNYLGTVDFVERDSVYADTKLTEIEHTQKWVIGREFDCAILVDRLDVLKMIYDPTSPYVERFREAAARKMDEIIMASAYGNVLTGKDGTVPSAFPNANTVAHLGLGMRVSKLRSLRKLMKKRFLDLRTLTSYIAVTSVQVDDLLGEVAVGSHDFNAVKPLVDGEVSNFMGFTFVPYEDNGSSTGGKGIPTFVDTGPVTVRQCPAWVEAGWHYGAWQGLDIQIGNRPDKNNIKQIHGTFTGGATRLEEGKLFQVQCVDAG